MNHEFTPVILVHLGAALAALALGAAVFFGRKGTFGHRVYGRIWVLLMLVTTVSTYWIRSAGGFSWIHGLSVITLILLARAVYLAMNGKIRPHQSAMKALYFGALIVAGAFTLLPQRLLGHALWSSVGFI